jgi:hypothetical protein
MGGAQRYPSRFTIPVLHLAMTDYRRNFIAGGSFFFTVNRMVKLGIFPEDWAGDIRDHAGNFGERP